MASCEICGKQFKSLAGLAGHKQFKHASSKQLPARSRKQLSEQQGYALSGIVKAGKNASVEAPEFGWRPGMPTVNFVDTALYLFFKEKGICLSEDGSWSYV